MKKSIVHLHVQTEYSPYRGICRVGKPGEKGPLLQAVTAQGMGHIAVTDTGDLHGAFILSQQSVETGINVLTGCEVQVMDAPNGETLTLVLLVENATGYANLLQLVSHEDNLVRGERLVVRRRVLQQYAEGLIALSGGLGGEVARHILDGNMAAAETAAVAYRDHFGRDDFYLEMTRNGVPGEQDMNAGLLFLHERTGIPLVAAAIVRCITPDDNALLPVHYALLDGVACRAETGTYHLRSAAEMHELFHDVPEAIANTTTIAERCRVHRVMPQPDKSHADISIATLRAFCLEELPRLYVDNEPAPRKRFEQELAMLSAAGAGYLLMVKDIVVALRRRGILVGPGRGAAGGSIVNYLLRITEIDPLRYGLQPEQFLAGNGLPNVDIDVDAARHDEVFDTISNLYGCSRVAHMSARTINRSKQILRDVAKVMGVPTEIAGEVAKAIPAGMRLPEAVISVPQCAAIANGADEHLRAWIDYACRLEGIVRRTTYWHSSNVIAGRTLSEIVPLRCRETGERVLHYDRDCFEHLQKVNENPLALVNVNVLALTTLTAIRRCLAEIGMSVEELRSLSPDDAEVYRALPTTCTEGVFLVGAEQAREYLALYPPRNFTELAAFISLQRSELLANGTTNKCLQQMCGGSVIAPGHPAIAMELAETNGVLIYREQLIQVLARLMGSSLLAAEQFRKKLRHGDREQTDIRDEFIACGMKNGIAHEQLAGMFQYLAQRSTWVQCKAHGVAYALLAYRTAWLNTYHPEAYARAWQERRESESDYFLKSVTGCGA